MYAGDYEFFRRSGGSGVIDRAFWVAYFFKLDPEVVMEKSIAMLDLYEKQIERLVEQMKSE